MKEIKKDKKGVFGLTAIQEFFAIILGIALLAYIIVIIMGTLSGTTILPQTSVTITNETLTGVTDLGVNLIAASQANADCTVTQCLNVTGAVLIPTTNYTETACKVSFTKGLSGGFNTSNWLCSYSATYDSMSQNQLKSVLGNTSSGVSGFFSNINPVYAILAVLVIILVLVVLVRVVQAPAGQSRTPQL